jgi:RNA recognition motif-containing protein
MVLSVQGLSGRFLQWDRQILDNSLFVRNISMTKLYVGNLPWTATEDDIQTLFSTVGEVQSASLILDRETRRSRGFAFVEMSQADAERAISQLNGKDFQGRDLRINEAQEKPRRSGGGGGGGGGRW